MDKLRELFKQLGGSDELVNALSEELNRYSSELKKQYDDEFNRRIQKARQICLEEVQKEKSALARKVSIFLESKLESIERAAEKQRLQEDTEATNKLKHLKALLEDVALDNSGQSRELRDVKKQLARTIKAFQMLKEERDIAVKKANKANEIATKVLQKNRLLESKVKAVNVLSENVRPARKVKAKIANSGKKRKTLTENRQKPARSVVTRSPVNSKSKPRHGSNDPIKNIARQLED